MKKHTGTSVKYFKDLLLNHQLREASVIESPSYFYHDGMSSSKIDYILISETLHNSMNEYQYLPTTAVNTSPHLALFQKFENELCENELCEKEEREQ